MAKYFRALIWVMLIATPRTASGTDSTGVIIDALRTHQIVLLSEEHKGIQFHGFLHQLLGDTRLSGVIDDIVLECGNPLYQDVVDRYIAGDDVTLDELRMAWRNTTQMLAWDSPLYEELFSWIRTVNLAQPAGRRYRVVLMDPKIDWSKVHTANDYKPYAQRSRDQLHRVESEVLERNHKALIIVGGAHVVRRSLKAPKTVVPLEDASLGDALGRLYPGRTFAVWTVPEKSRLSKSLDRMPVPTIIPVTEHHLGGRSFADAAPTGMMVQRVVDGKKRWEPLTASDWPRMRAMADALLFLGPRTTAEPPPSVFREPAYYDELLRRAKIMSDVFGIEFGQMVKEAAGRNQ